MDQSLTGGVITKADLVEVKTGLKADITRLDKAIQKQTIILGGLMVSLVAALKFFPLVPIP